jgi:hypothetical protein
MTDTALLLCSGVCSPFTVGAVTFAAVVAEEWQKQQQRQPQR